MNQFTEQSRKKLDIKRIDTDFVAGLSSIPYVINVPDGDWRAWFTDTEKQLLRWDTNGCSQYSSIKTLEAQCNRLLNKGAFSSEALTFFDKNKYLIDGQFNFSIEYNAILSGTTINGNNPIYCFISAQKDGLIPQWMLEMTLEQSQQYNSQEEQDAAFYSVSRVTQAMRDMGRESLKYISVAYQWIGAQHYIQPTFQQMQTAMLQAPLTIAVPVPANVYLWNNDTVSYDGKKELDHCVGINLVSIKVNDAFPFYIYDNYNPFQKRLSRDYYIPQVLQGIVTAITPPVEAPILPLAGFNITLPLSATYPISLKAIVQTYLLQNRLLQDNVATFFMPSGFWGQQTTESVKNYQTKYMLKLTGYIDPDTMAHIQKYG